MYVLCLRLQKKAVKNKFKKLDKIHIPENKNICINKKN